MAVFRDIDTDVRINGGIHVNSASSQSKFSGRVVFDKSYGDGQEAIRIAPATLPSVDAPRNVLTVARGNTVVMSIDSNGKIKAPDMEVERITYSETGSVEGDLSIDGKIITTKGGELGNDINDVTEVTGSLIVTDGTNNVLSVDPASGNVTAGNFVGKINGYQINQDLLKTSSVTFNKVNGLTLSTSGISGTNKLGNVTLSASTARTITVNSNVTLAHSTHAKTSSDNYNFNQNLRTTDSPTFQTIKLTGNLGLGVVADENYKLNVGGSIAINGSLFVTGGREVTAYKLEVTGTSIFRDNISLSAGKTIQAVSGNITIKSGSSGSIVLNNNNLKINPNGQIVSNLANPFSLSQNARNNKVANLNAELLDGNTITDIYDKNTFLLGGGVIYGYYITATPSPSNDVLVSAGEVYIKGEGYFSTNGQTIGGFSTDINTWDYVVIVGKYRQAAEGGKTFNPGEIAVIRGVKDGGEPALPEGDILLAKVKRTVLGQIRNADIYPFRKMGNVHIDDVTRTMHLFTQDNKGAMNEWLTVAQYQDKTPVGAVRMTGDGKILAKGDIVTEGGISTNNGVPVDVSSKAPNWDIAYAQRHEHHTIFKKGNEIDTKTVMLPGPTYPRSSNDIAVYKNGQRMFYNVDYTVPSSNNSVIFNHPHTFGDDDLVVVDYILRTNSTS